MVNGVRSFRNLLADSAGNRGRILLAAVLTAALALRVAAFFSLKQSIYFDTLLIDEKIYHNWAVRIADGTFAANGVYEMAPLPAYLWAFIYRVLSPDPVHIRWLNILLGTAVCYFIYRIGKTLGGVGVGIGAALLAALYQPFVFYSVVPLKTALAVFLFAASICFFLEALDSGDWRRFALCGVGLGLLANVRPQALAILPLPVLAVAVLHGKEKPGVKASLKRVLLYLAGFALAVSPFVIRNYRVAGQWGLTVSQGGFNLYIGNHLGHSDPYYRPVPFTSTVPSEQGIQFTIEASRRVGRKLTAQDASKYWTREVLTTAMEQPVAVARKLLLKTLAVFNRFEPGNNYHIGFMGDHVPFFKAPLPGYGLVLPLAMTGLVLLIRRSLKIQAVAAILLLYGATLVLFHCSTTYRLPMLVLLIPLSAAGIAEAVRRFPGARHRSLLPALAGLGLFGVLTVLPVPGTGDLSAYTNMHAIILNSRGRSAEAVRYWERSLEMKGAYSLFAAYSLAARAAEKGDFPAALKLLDRIPDQSYASAMKYGFTADILMRLGQGRQAVAALEKSLSINSGQRRARAKLAAFFKRRDPARARLEMEKLRYIESFYNVF
ncbi:MAG: glycosyltransferase family 39 protein [Desulfobacterales bacterium]|nr:glycosyltransferase family 39 protein [Desulfobacterales bacterium]